MTVNGIPEWELAHFKPPWKTPKFDLSVGANKRFTIRKKDPVPEIKAVAEFPLILTRCWTHLERAKRARCAG